MKHIASRIFFIVFFINNFSISAQVVGMNLTDADKTALEGIIVEKYYTADSKDYKDTIGGTLPQGSVTYRIYIDLKPDYTMQAVFGIVGHELRIETSTEFFNYKLFDAPTGDLVDSKKINDNNLALDSWVTMSAATNAHLGILKSEDKDGSIIKRAELSKADGLKAGAIRPITFFGLDLSFFQGKHKSLLSSEDGSWAVFGGIKGPTEDNKILIAQLTTNGTLSYQLNIQVGTPKGGSVQYVAKNPVRDEIQFDGLVSKK